MSVIVRLGVPVLLSSPDVSNIFAGETDGMRIPMSVSFSGNLFSGNASASVTFFEPHALVGKLMPKDFGGLWTLTVNGIVSFIGYVANMRTQRTIGNGYIKAMNFSGICKAWDVTCAAKILPTGATEETPSDTYTAKTALTDLVAIVSDGSMSGIPLDGDIPDTAVLIRDMYSDHVLTITNSTYLAEIQRLALYLGCAVFQHPSHKSIAITDVLHPMNNFEYTKERCSKASFDVNFETIPATILVCDDVTQDADSFGYLGVPSVPTNYDFTGRNDMAYASTVGIEKEHLKTIAKQLYYIGLFGSQVLRFKYAGLPPNVEMLGRWFQWTDPIGGTGKYVVNSFSTTYVRTSCWTEIEAYMMPVIPAE
jgi:hypothetical protein